MGVPHDLHADQLRLRLWRGEARARVPHSAGGGSVALRLRGERGPVHRGRPEPCPRARQGTGRRLGGLELSLSKLSNLEARMKGYKGDKEK